MGQTPTAATKTPDEKWEDQAFVDLHRDIFREITPEGHIDNARWRLPQVQFKPEHIRRWRELAQFRCQQPRWGFKDPRFPFLMDMGIGILAGLNADIRIIWLTRGIHAVASSLHKRDGGEFAQHLEVAATQIKRWTTLTERYIDWPGCQLRYEDILAQPEVEIRKLAAAVSLDPEPETIQTAVNKVGRPTLPNWWPG